MWGFLMFAPRSLRLAIIAILTSLAALGGFTILLALAQSAFTGNFTHAAEIWDTTIPLDQDWSTAAAATAAIATLVAIWKRFQDHQNKAPPYGNRCEESLLDLIETKF